MLLFALPYGAYGQFNSSKGWIESDFVAGCAPLSFVIKHTGLKPGTLFYTIDGDPNNPQFTNADGALDPGEENTIEYLDPGTYHIILVDQGVIREYDSLKITVYPNDPPQVSYNSCQGNSVQLEFRKDQDIYDFYRIDFGDNNIVEHDGESPLNYSYSTPGVYRLTVRGMLNTGNASSCRVAIFNVSSFENLPPPVLNTVEVVDEQSFRIAYEELEPNLNYTLEINRGNGFEVVTSIDPDNNPTSFEYSNNALSLNDSYVGIRLMVADDCGTQTIYSETGYTIAFSLYDESVDDDIEMTIAWLTSTTDFSDIRLHLNGLEWQTYSEAENSNGQSLSFNSCTELGTLQMVSVFNGVTSLSQSLEPFNGQPFTLPAPPAPQISVRGAVVEVVLPATNFPLGRYILYRKDIEADFAEIFSTAETEITDTTIPPGTSEVCYRLVYEDACGNLSETSEQVCLILSTNLGVPNAFSPNGDGINDIFKVSDGIYNNFVLSVYSRWGSLVFETTNPSEGWDGNFNGEPAASGTYLYRVSFENADNQPIRRTGSFILIR